MSIALLMLALLGCRTPTASCEVANARLGVEACVNTVPDLETWDRISVPSEAIDQHRVTKWAMPWDEAGRPSPLAETVFLNSTTYALHWEMLRDAFPAEFPGLTLMGYSRMVLDPREKVLQSGDLLRFVDPATGQPGRWGFTIWDDRTRPERTLTYDAALAVFEELQPRFAPDALAFVPNTPLQEQNAARWVAEHDPPFRVIAATDISYEVYTEGVGYGVVQRVALEDLAPLESQGAIRTTDVLVLDQAPFDLAQPISAVITGTRQGDLSHLNVRAAARGTPNCFVPDPHALFEVWEGALVRVECGPARLSIEAADPDEAEAYWALSRPPPVDLAEPDLSVVTPVGLLELDTSTAAARAGAVRAYGSKGTHLATLYQRIDADLQLDGFLLPFAGYDQFAHAQTWSPPPAIDDAPVGTESFADSLARWHADPAFLDDPTVRRPRLAALRDAMSAAPLASDTVDAVAQSILDVWNDPTVMVRFRSSSNAEDALAFSGAGLYDSTSVCVADSYDADEAGPSLCDPDQPDERTIERGLKRVWASLWKDGAWEERDWYGIDHTRASMGILVNTRSEDEQSNAVAFSGHPIDGSLSGMLVNAQVGPLDVVSAAPGVFPERLLVDPAEGTVTRLGGSSELEGGQVVLSDARALELATPLAAIDAVFPIDEEAPSNTTVLLDTEWKVLSDGRLVIKQVRPFARDDAP
jgi:hypothetical protein